MPIFEDEHYYSMFTRTELKLLTIPQLKNLCNRYGLKPLASGAYKDNYIDVLLAFPYMAIQQMDAGMGLRSLSLPETEQLIVMKQKLG